MSEQKTLPPVYFYDALGSSLFEAITLLPEYGLTRADQSLIEAHAAEIVAAARVPKLVVELGSGSGRKTGALLRALGRQVRYAPVDVSAGALADCAAVLGGFAAVTPIEGEFVEGLKRAVALRVAGEPVLVLFLGSTIGNFDRSPALELLRSVCQVLRPGDSLLLGADLMKPAARLVLAYDDPAGVTAAFNLNLLGRINRELGGGFDLRKFRHMARWEAGARRIEMHLVSTVKQSVEIPGADCTVCFREDESIWTESSHKYELDDLAEMSEASGFSIVRNWVECDWGFVESLWRRE